MPTKMTRAKSTRSGRSKTSVAGTKTKRKYKTVSCHTTKTAAKKKQKSLHTAGKTARLAKKDGRWCVASAGAKKKK